ncbi:sulfotransferase family 2 domain-containing protein [Salinisphaera aquimarina]|uniref:Sulfotransferase family 2 domain-containing protein n=1 Tax=Salinisphaera aquimarina TaxID=2094031 RepID=A0ABV7EVG4_9GAMM
MIALIHIKKTAGKSLKHIMRCEFGTAHCDVKRWNSSDAYFSAADLRRLQRVHPRLQSLAGHSIRSVSDLRSAAPGLRYYTFLRDPIKRCISEYQYSVRQGRCAPGSFASWIEKPAYRNVQVKSLAGSDDLDMAIAQVDTEISFVGLMERFDESLALMQPLLELPRFTPLQRRVNAASDHAIRDALLADNEAMDAVRQANRLDSALFEHVAGVIYPRQQRQAARVSVAVTAGKPRPVERSPRQFNARFLANGVYRYLVYKPAVSAYQLVNRG